MKVGKQRLWKQLSTTASGNNFREQRYQDKALQEASPDKREYSKPLPRKPKEKCTFSCGD